ncbi:S8 family serine peptidase [Catellatospora sichuanensis]|uniref:S8 family serine peptidase n=1 Tax=Catellatospora sichuanensis TaxID=1969805 RepID=UPI001643218C|nr:S8 family serine peptidase [Catellatospora sichuanensis]
MKLPPRFLAAGLSAVVVAGTLSVWSPADAATPAPQRRVIVLLAGDAAVASAPAGALRDAAGAAQITGARKAVQDRQRAFLDGARGKGLRLTRERPLGLLVNAIAATVPADDVARLSALPGVLAVVPDQPVRAFTDVSVPLVGATEVWQREDATGTPAKGKGVTVAVIDSGVDYSHPDLGGGMGDGFKVVGGYDFVNGDADPMDDNGHGTHVAGIIAGKAAAAGGVTGVAPEANLLAYKAMNEWGEGYTSDIVASIEAAADPANPHRADVINMSLGGYGDGLDPLGMAATAATRAGVVVVAAAGNSGPGRDTVGTPAVADGVIAVGASTSNMVLPTAYVGGLRLQTYRGVLSANPAAKPVTGRLVDAGYGSTEELDAAGDLRGKVVRISGYAAPVLDHLSQWELDLAKELERRGALAVISGQADSGPVVAAADGTVPVVPSNSVHGLPKGLVSTQASGDLYRMDKLVVLGMDGTQFAELSTRLAAGPVDVTLKGEDVTDRIAAFSSRGPSLRFGLKPDLVAPGVLIRSTVPTALFGPGQYLMSGTSMAAPHVAGAAALLRQLHPGQAPADVLATLVGSAKPVGGTPTAYGSGRLDVAAAARTTLTANPASVSFGLADLGGPTVGGSATVTLHNSGTRASTVRLRADGKAVSVQPDRVTVPAGRTAKVTVTLRAERPAGDTEISGVITADGGAGQVARVPYLLVVRPLVVAATPDPSDGHSTVWIGAPTGLAAAPVVTVDPPHGRSYTVTATHQYDNVYTADLTGEHPGAYGVSVRGTAVTGQRLIGSSSFEVIPEDVRRNRWEPVGPNGTGGQLAVTPADGALGVMTTDYKAGPWLTTDHGTSWSQLNRLPVAGSAGIATPVLDAKNASRWWYAVNDPQTGGRILRTVDRGRTWQTLPVPSGWVDALLADAQTRVLVAVVSGTLLTSLDGGDTWTPQQTGLPGEIAYAAIGGEDLYLSTHDGVWQLPGVTSGTPGTAVQVYDSASKYLAGLVADEGVVAASVWGEGVVGSHDGGKNWSTLYSRESGLHTMRTSGGDLYVATLSGEGLVGRDHGRTWESVPLPARDALVTDYDRWADGTATTATSAGLYTSEQGGYRRLGVQGTTVYDLAMVGGDLLAGTENGLYRTASPAAGPEWGAAIGEGWIGEGAEFLAVSPTDPKTAWKIRRAAWGDQFMFGRSDDGGQSWTEVFTGTEKPTALLIHPADDGHVYAGFERLTGQGLTVTLDGGRTWKNLYLDERVNALAGDPANAKRLWLGMNSGLYRSDDGGVNLTKVADGQVTALRVDGKRLVVGGETIRTSTDGGRTFRTADTGPLGLMVSDFAANGDTLYAATTTWSAYGLAKGGRGVLRSVDGGRTWHNISSGLQNLDVTTLAVSPDGRWLFAGTLRGGVHRIPLR